MGHLAISPTVPGPGDVLDLLRRTGPRTRAELQAVTGTSRVTLTGRIQALQNAGLVVDDKLLATRGRPTSRLAFNERFGYFAVEAMETSHARTAVTDLSGEVVICGESSADVKAGPEVSLARSVESVLSLLKQAGIKRSELVGVGISLPGPVDPSTERPSEPPIMPGWDGVAVGDIISTQLGVPALVENDANAMALGIQRWKFPEASSLLLIKVGTGIGSGLVVEGRLHRGVDGGAGDIGHIQLFEDGEVLCRCGAYGCLAAAASGWAVAQKLHAKGYQTATGRDVRALLTRGEPDAVDAVLQAGRDLGRVGASLVSMVNPEVLVLVGDLASSALLSGFRETLYARSLPRATRNLKVAMSLDRDHAIHGTAQALADRVFHPDAINRRLAG